MDITLAGGAKVVWKVRWRSKGGKNLSQPASAPALIPYSTSSSPTPPSACEYRLGEPGVWPREAHGYAVSAKHVPNRVPKGPSKQVLGRLPQEPADQVSGLLLTEHHIPAPDGSCEAREPVKYRRDLGGNLRSPVFRDVFEPGPVMSALASAALSVFA